MSDDAGTLTLARTAQPETDLEVKRSHFLGRAARTRTQEEARAFIASVRAAHPAARHHCSAFIVTIPGGRPIERSNDDGEPSGTAGQPILEVLRGTGLVDATVVVTRYFGGTLLGTGGLVRAYGEAAARALKAAARVRLVTRHLWDGRRLPALSVPPIPRGACHHADGAVVRSAARRIWSPRYETARGRPRAGREDPMTAHGVMRAMSPSCCLCL